MTQPTDLVVAEVGRTDAGTMAVRGPMVPQHAFPPGIEDFGLPHIKMGDTGYTCRFDVDKKALVVTGPPAGMIRVGGYRFPLLDLRGLVGGIDAGRSLACCRTRSSASGSSGRRPTAPPRKRRCVPPTSIH